MFTHTAQSNEFRIALAAVVVAGAAIYRAIIYGLKRNLSFVATIGADNREQFTRFVSLLLANGAAATATHGFVLEALFGIKFLFRSGEQEFLSTILADESFVFKSHV